MKRLCLVLLVLGCARSQPEVPILNYHSAGGDVADDYNVPVTAFEQLYRHVSVVSRIWSPFVSPPMNPTGAQ